MSIKKQNQRAFTLVEIIFYFVIIGIFLLAAMNFAIQTLNITKESESIHELQANIDFISQRIVSTVQTAESINDAGSIFDNDEGALSLNITPAAKSPTTFYLSNESVYMTEGSSPTVKITSDLIRCALLRFQKISTSKVPDQIIIDAEFQWIYGDILSLEQNLSIHTSVNLRK